MNEFKRGYHPRSILVKDENYCLLADSHNILNRWKNYFSQLFNVHSIHDVRQIIHTAEPIVCHPSPFEVEIGIVKSKKFKSPGSGQIPAELFQAEDEALLSEIINSLIPFGIRKNCLISRRNLLLFQFTKD
jgi:hypothetical protein